MLKSLISRIRSSTLARNAGWIFAGQGLSVFVQGSNFVILARLLGARQYGVLAGAAALVAVVSQYSGLGSGLIFLRYVSPDPTRFREYWGNILMAIGTFGTLVVIGLHIAGRWLVGPEGASILIFLALGDCICQQLTNCASQVFQAFEKMKYTAGLSLSVNLVRLVLAASMFLIFKTATARQWAMASLFVSVVAATAAFVMVTRRFGKPKFMPKLLAARASEGFVFALSGSTTTVYNDIDKVMLGHYGMNVANGIYSMAYRVVNIGAMPIVSIFAAAFPRFFREGAKGINHVEPYARNLLKKTAVLGLGIAACMFLCAPIIPHLVGKGFADSVSALRWLCLIPFFRSFHLSSGDAIAGAGHQKFRLLAQASAAGGNFLMNLYLIPHYSWVGAAWASLATDAILGALNWGFLLYLCRREKESLTAVSA
jgi:O-antigen/teichoic acid export membrane protein